MADSARFLRKCGRGVSFEDASGFGGFGRIASPKQAGGETATFHNLKRRVFSGGQRAGADLPRANARRAANRFSRFAAKNAVPGRERAKTADSTIFR